MLLLSVLLSRLSGPSPGWSCCDLYRPQYGHTPVLSMHGYRFAVADMSGQHACVCLRLGNFASDELEP